MMRALLILCLLLCARLATAETLLIGQTCAPGGVGASGFSSDTSGSQAFIMPRTGPGMNIVSANCGVQAGGPQSGAIANASWASYKAGTAQNLACWIQTAPNAGGNNSIGWIYTVYVAGAATSVTCSILGASKSCSDSSHTAAIVLGDLLSINWTANNGVSETTTQAGGCVFEVAF